MEKETERIKINIGEDFLPTKLQSSQICPQSSQRARQGSWAMFFKILHSILWAFEALKSETNTWRYILLHFGNDHSYKNEFKEPNRNYCKKRTEKLVTDSPCL